MATTNPLVTLNMTATQAQSLARMSKGDRDKALNHLRLYYALLFHPDKNGGPADALAKYNSAIDDLLASTDMKQLVVALPKPGGRVDPDEIRCLKRKITEKGEAVQRCAQQIGQLNAQIESLKVELDSERTTATNQCSRAERYLRMNRQLRKRKANLQKDLLECRCQGESEHQPSATLATPR